MINLSNVELSMTNSVHSSVVGYLFAVLSEVKLQLQSYSIL
jgi:hypothetical protein